MIRILYRTFGARGTARRVRFELRRRAGWFTGSPSGVIAGPPPQVTRSVYEPHPDYRQLPTLERTRALAAAECVLAGSHHAYGGEWRPVPRGTLEWQTDPTTGAAFGSGPWWTVAHLPGHGDIKHVWEPGRFGWAYDLMRGATLSGDPRYEAQFSDLLLDWWSSNPPMTGPHWVCGQETAIRAVALLHAEAVWPALETTAAGRVLRAALVASAERIADALDYGLSQRNNHGISETAALIHLGCRLKGQHPKAARWLRGGLRILTEQLRDQFSPDGWYAQHSFTYMRLALDQAVLAQRVLAVHGQSLPPDCLERLEKSVQLLVSMVCGETGVVPNHGNNDGGRTLIYSSAPYRDFRPALTLAAATLGIPLPADVLADPEVVAWIGHRPGVAPPRQDAVVSGPSGWAVARVGRVSVFMRAGELRHRPSHLDSLHIDIRVGTKEMVCDPGTFAYNAPAPWRNGLATAMVHNGPVLNGQEPGVKGPRFLWWAWPAATMVASRLEAGTAILVGQLLDPSSREPLVERSLSITEGGVVVKDRHRLDGPATLQVTWLLHPEVGAEFAVNAGLRRHGCSDVQALPCLTINESGTAGWFSPTYGIRQAARTLRVEATGVNRDATIETVFQLGDVL